LGPIFPFWALRFVARGKEGAVKTGIVANLTIGVVTVLLYLPLVTLITSALGISGEYVFLYFLVAVQILEYYAQPVLEGCLQAIKPQVIGYGWLLSEFCKVGLGYVLINTIQPLYGAIIAMIMALSIKLIFYIKLLSEELKQRVRWEYAKEWIKGSLVNIYSIVGNQIANFIFIMLFLPSFGGEGARSDYGAAAQIATIIGYSSTLAFALYPKLLAERKREDVTTSLRTVLMFSIPMALGAILLSDSLLTILKPEYREATPILIVLAIDALVSTASGIYNTVLLGYEKVDEEGRISLKELARSRLLVLFSLPYVQSAITLPTAYYVLTTYTQKQPWQAALYVGIINSSVRFAMFLILYVMVRKMVRIEIPWKNITKYVFAATVMATVLFTIPHPTTIALTLGTTLAGGIVYLLLAAAIDKEARTLITSIWQEIKSRIRRS
jgi:O-antigen/teichoic acid export membrane protein